MIDKYLFLDAVNIPIDVYEMTGNELFKDEEWDVVRTYGEFYRYINSNGFPKFIAFNVKSY